MKAYSLNDEDFRYDTIGEVMSALEDSDDLIAGAEYFEIETESVDLAEYLDADTMLETAEERAYEELGECAKDAFRVTKEAAEELGATLKTWAAKHLPAGYWRCVGKSQRITVTAEDVAEYAGPAKD